MIYQILIKRFIKVLCPIQALTRNAITWAWVGSALLRGRGAGGAVTFHCTVRSRKGVQTFLCVFRKKCEQAGSWMCTAFLSFNESNQ